MLANHNHIFIITNRVRKFLYSIEIWKKSASPLIVHHQPVFHSWSSIAISHCSYQVPTPSLTFLWHKERKHMIFCADFFYSFTRRQDLCVVQLPWKKFLQGSGGKKKSLMQPERKTLLFFCKYSSEADFSHLKIF